MALALNAEQKSIFDIFSGKNQYIIPPYQRSYSWNEVQCMELFEDLRKAYEENKKEGYFLGNIVIAKSFEERTRLEVIDGQQRLTTLTLLIKVLLAFDGDNIDLKNAIHIPGGRRGDAEKQRLKTNVFIEKDAKFLEEALSLELNDEICQIHKKDNQFKKNICYFYKEVKKFKEDNNIQDFIDFFMWDISLLPIQTEDSSPDKAREKALKIFETINNRGLNLSDSDIFKAKLYSMALNESQHEDFIEKWKELDEESQDINHTINDIFRFYTQIIRGKEGITKSEIGLREFFTQKVYSPFETIRYDEVLNDLFKIIKIIKFFKEVIKNPEKYSELTKWFQLIEQYTNQYPLNTLLVYLYVHGLENNDKLIQFSENLVRYAYYHGATTKIKFPLFALIGRIMKGEKTFENYPKMQRDLEYFGLLKKGFALLCFYLNSEQKAIYPHYFSKIVNSRDTKNLNSTWDERDYSDYSDTLGNMIIIDIKISRDIKLSRKKLLLEKSSINEMKILSYNLNNWSYQDYQNREISLKNRLIKFFEKTDDN